MSQIIIEEAKLQHNIDVIKEKIQNRNDDKGNPLKIIAVLKGNAYGMGVQLVAKKLLDNNIDFFAVTELDEALELRKASFKNDILVLNATCIQEELNKIIENDLIATVGSKESIEKLNEIAKQNNKIARCHLKIDTGFCRFGFLANDTIGSELKEILKDKKNLKIEGTYSHFQESYANDEKRTREQLNQFLNAIEKLKVEKIDTGMLHICNSAAFFKYPEMYLNAVRIGSAFTGRLQILNPTGLQKVGYLESSICEIRDLKKGDKVGYSGTCELKKDTKVAIIEAGYADGIGVDGPKDSVRLIDKLRTIKTNLLALTKDGARYVEIQNKKCPILGRIGMKNMMVDISECEAKIGDKVKIEIKLVLANSKIERLIR